MHVLGPFDEHLVTDVGSLFVALGVVLAFAALSLRRGTVLAAATAWLIFSVPHFLWHVFNLEPYGTADAVANTVTLGWTVVGGVLVLVLALRRPRERAAAVAPGSGGRIAEVSDARAGLLARAAFRYSRRDVRRGDRAAARVRAPPGHPGRLRRARVRDREGRPRAAPAQGRWPRPRPPRWRAASSAWTSAR